MALLHTSIKENNREMQHFISEPPDPAVFTLMISVKRTAAWPSVSWMHPPSLTHTPDLHCVIIKKDRCSKSVRSVSVCRFEMTLRQVNYRISFLGKLSIKKKKATFSYVLTLLLTITLTTNCTHQLSSPWPVDLHYFYKSCWQLLRFDMKEKNLVWQRY